MSKENYDNYNQDDRNYRMQEQEMNSETVFQNTAVSDSYDSENQKYYRDSDNEKDKDESDAYSPIKAGENSAHDPDRRTLDEYNANGDDPNGDDESEEEDSDVDVDKKDKSDL